MRLRQRGDTIIEVLFAMTIFSLVAVGGLSLMNQGASIAERALEIGLVRQQMDAQADGLRYLNRAFVADFGKNGAGTKHWNEVVVQRKTNEAQDFESVGAGDSCHLPAINSGGSQPFALDVNKLDSDTSSDMVIVPTSDVASYAKLSYGARGSRPVAQGIWVEAVRSSDAGTGTSQRPGYYDFHIRACWFAPGQQEPIVLGTIVRLYEPRT